MDRQGDT